MSTSSPSSVSAVIIAKNEADMIANCIETVRWCQEIIVIDNGSTDATAEIADQLGARVVSIKTNSFAQLRTKALRHVKTDWVFYIDADERVTPTLAREIQVHLETNSGAALQLDRQNIYYGTHFKHGGWNNDRITRIFNRDSLKEWQGDVHETPVFEGDVVQLHTPLLHLSHRNTLDGLQKTIEWTPIEARLLFEANAPDVKLTTVLRKGVMEFVRRAYFKQGVKDGLSGLMEAVIQAINRVLVYVQLWELQQVPTLEETYQTYEERVAAEWLAEQSQTPKNPRPSSKTKN